MKKRLFLVYFQLNPHLCGKYQSGGRYGFGFGEKKQYNR